MVTSNMRLTEVFGVSAHSFHAHVPPIPISVCAPPPHTRSASPLRTLHYRITVPPYYPCSCCYKLQQRYTLTLSVTTSVQSAHYQHGSRAWRRVNKGRRHLGDRGALLVEGGAAADGARHLELPRRDHLLPQPTSHPTRSGQVTCSSVLMLSAAARLVRVLLYAAPTEAAVGRC